MDQLQESVGLILRQIISKYVKCHDVIPCVFFTHAQTQYTFHLHIHVILIEKRTGMHINNVIIPIRNDNSIFSSHCEYEDQISCQVWMGCPHLGCPHRYRLLAENVCTLVCLHSPAPLTGRHLFIQYVL